MHVVLNLDKIGNKKVNIIPSKSFLQFLNTWKLSVQRSTSFDLSNLPAKLSNFTLNKLIFGPKQRFDNYVGTRWELKDNEYKHFVDSI